MPRTNKKQEGLLDAWGRRNKKYSTKQCAECGKVFMPRRESSAYCSVPCARKKNGGHNKKAESWWKNSKGYIEGKVWLPDGSQIWVKKHRFVVEGILGRPLKPTEDVHHKDGDKTNNDPSNLEVISHGEHTKLHNSKRDYNKGYKLNLTQEQRKSRSLKAIAQCLSEMGRLAIAKATTPQP